MKLPAYPRTKPSGVEWLGDVPEHWDAKPHKRAVNFVEGPGIMAADFTDDGIPLLRISCIGGRRATLEGCNFVSAQLATTKWAHFRVKPSDLLISGSASTGFCSEVDGATVGSIPYTGIIIRPLTGKSDRDFIRWFFLSELFLDQSALARTGSTIQHFGPTHLSKMFMVLPDLCEQRAIAAFLDRETGRVDELVAKKRELIERLKEKRAALISRTVTHGLPPAAARAAGLPENPPLKPSGVPWFDECPSHWRTKRLRHISDFVVVGVVVNPSSYVTDEGVVFLLGGDVREMRIDTTDCKRCSPESSNGPLVKSRLDAGDLVVVRVGYPGVAAVVPPELTGGNVASMMLVRKHPRFCSQWLAYAFNSQVGRDQVEIVQYGAAQKQFNISHAVDFAFPFPPLPEQAAIAGYLDQETAKLDALVGKVEAAVERLQEYRTALITAAVTGKIDVRSKIRI